MCVCVSRSLINAHLGKRNAVVTSRRARLRNQALSRIVSLAAYRHQPILLSADRRRPLALIGGRFQPDATPGWPDPFLARICVLSCLPRGRCSESLKAAFDQTHGTGKLSTGPVDDARRSSKWPRGGFFGARSRLAGVHAKHAEIPPPSNRVAHRVSATAARGYLARTHIPRGSPRAHPPPSLSASSAARARGKGAQDLRSALAVCSASDDHAGRCTVNRRRPRG